MIPAVSVLTSDLTVEEQPGKTYRMTGGRISGTADNIEAVRQAVFKILNTERYQYVIYSWNYGVELSDLFGKPAVYVKSEVERRIKEALLRDSRITSVDSFEFERQKHSLLVTFTVHSEYGDVESSKEVKI